MKLVVDAADVGRKCDANFCNLDFALLIVERSYELHSRDVKNNKRYKGIRSQPKESDHLDGQRQETVWMSALGDDTTQAERRRLSVP